MCPRYLLAFLALVVFANCEDIYKKCGDKLSCVEQEMIRVIDDVDQEARVHVLGDYLVVDKVYGISQIVPRSEDIMDRVLRYVKGHEIKIKAPEGLLAEARSSKLKKILLPLLLLLKLKAAIVLPAVLSAIALVAFKGLGVSLLSFVISAFAAFKGLLETHSSSKFSYEIVPQPLQGPQWSRNGMIPVNPLESWPQQGYHTVP